MEDEDIIRVHIKTAREMGFLGGAFGAHLFKTSITVPYYSSTRTGKTTMALSSVKAISRPFYYTCRDRIESDRQIAHKEGIELKSSRCLLQWMDYGYDLRNPLIIYTEP